MRPLPLPEPLAGQPGSLDPRPAAEFAPFQGPAAGARVQTILVGVDGTPGGQAALAWTARLARAWDARVVVATVRVPSFVPWGAGGPGWWMRPDALESREAAGRQVVEEVVSELARVGVPTQRHDDVGAPADRLAWATRLHAAQLCVVGADRDPDPTGAGLGVVARALVLDPPGSILLARRAPFPGPVIAFGDATEAGEAIARELGLPFVAAPILATPAEGETRVRAARPCLAVLPSGAGRLASALPCSTLVLGA